MWCTGTNDLQNAAVTRFIHRELCLAQGQNQTKHLPFHPVQTELQVELQMRATDVIHSLYVPEFRLKQDVVPGITTKLIVRTVV